MWTIWIYIDTVQMDLGFSGGQCRLPALPPPSSSDKLFFDSIRYRYDMRVFFSIRYDTIRYEGLKEDLLFEEFSANFQNFRRIFGIFGAVVVVDDFGSWVF